MAAFVEPASVGCGLQDPDDEIYLAIATAGGAALITGNSRDSTDRHPAGFMSRRSVTKEFRVNVMAGQN